MDRLLGAKDRRDAEPEAAEQSFDNAARGAQHEEFSDVEHTVSHAPAFILPTDLCD